MSLPAELVPLNIPHERPGSGKISFGQNGVSGTRDWAVPWELADGTSYWVNFVQRLLGMTIAGPTGTPVITYPDVYSEQFPWLYCQACDVSGEEPLGTDRWGRIKYRRALINARYMPYEMGESISLAGQALPFAKDSFAFLGRLFTDPPRFDVNAAGAMSPQEIVRSSEQFIIDYNGWRASADTYLVNPGLSDDEFAGAQTIHRLYWDPPLPPPPRPTAAFTLTLVLPTTVVAPLTPGQRYTTAAITAEATATEIKTALEALGVTGAVYNVTGGPISTASVFVTFGGVLKNLDVPLLTMTQIGVIPPTLARSEKTQAGRVGKNTGPVEQTVTKVIPTGEYSLDRHQVLAPNFWSFISLIGTVNCYYFLGFQPWSLLFTGMDGHKTILPNGTRCWDLKFKFHFNPYGWNMIFRPKTGQWEVVAAVGKAKQTFWSIKQTSVFQPPELANPSERELHPWLYRPADFAPIISFG